MRYAKLPAIILTCLTALSSPLSAQVLPASGTRGIQLVYGSSPAGDSQLFAISLSLAPGPIPLGSSVANRPSRWSHRRRTLGATETVFAYIDTPDGGLAVCPMGDSAGKGALHLVDFRTPFPFSSELVPTVNPACYDLAVAETLQYVFCAEDDGAGGTRLRGYSYATPGQLTPLNPPSLTLPGSPAAYCNRVGVGAGDAKLEVPTTDGIQEVHLSSGTPAMVLGSFISSLPASPTTNPIRFELGGNETWVIGTSTFSSSGDPTEAGFVAWSGGGTIASGTWGTIPGLSPLRSYVPSAGAEELAVVSNSSEAYIYYLLRDPSPTAFFIRPSAVGAVHFSEFSAPAMSTIPCPEEMGEPFAIPTVSNGMVAIESSFGPPFTNSPTGGGEKVSLLYSPLHPLGAGTPFGTLGCPDPLGGRVSTKGMDRPLWSRSGDRVVAFTSHFPGAPNPALPGIEVLDVPAAIPVDAFVAPHTVVPNLANPHRSIILPTSYRPLPSSAPDALAGLSFCGGVFHDGMAAVLMAPFGELGQLQLEATPLQQDPDIPNFPAVFPPTFSDAQSSWVPIPGDFGARRASFNLTPGWGLDGLVLVAAVDDVILVQPTGFNFLAQVGAHAAEFAPIKLYLPSGWVTSTEFVSL
ncbi:MAG TPA: hypothetical protein ENK43_14745 [Planctomycetes bacterium]|nr:hypothetical protein [Planctomycetota bacterium]